MAAIALAVLVTLAGGLGGCSRAVQADNPIEIGPEEYHPVYDATIAVLRDRRFTIDRQDRRFGVVTTGPVIAASAFEPWHDDNTTTRQVVENTLNHQRRRVRVQMHPAAPAAEDDADEAPDENGEADATDEATADADAVEAYEVSVHVYVERRQHPPRELNSSIFSGMELRRRPRMHEPLVTEEGLIESHWRPVRRDRELEQRLIAEIIRRSIEIESSQSPPLSSSPSPSQAGSDQEAQSL